MCVVQSIIRKSINQLVSINTMDNLDNLNIVLVGFILDYDENYIILESIDTDGILESYDLFKISYINQIENSNPYLDLMKKYIKIQKQYYRYNIYNLSKPDRSFYTQEGKISIARCLNNLFINKQLICISFEGYKNDMAYITNFEHDYVFLKEIDTLDATFEEYIDLYFDNINSLSIQNSNTDLISESLSL